MYYKGIVRKTTEYRIKNTATQYLLSNGFRYRASMSSADDNIYEYVFPVYRYHAAISLEARFLVHQETQLVVVDVFDTGTRGIYGPWYHDNSGIHHKMISIINSNILKEMKKLQITEMTT